MTDLKITSDPSKHSLDPSDLEDQRKLSELSIRVARKRYILSLAPTKNPLDYAQLEEGERNLSEMATCVTRKRRNLSLAPSKLLTPGVRKNMLDHDSLDTDDETLALMLETARQRCVRKRRILSQARNRGGNETAVHGVSKPVSKSHDLSLGPSKLLTIKEAAAYIHDDFKTTAIQKAIRSGELPADKLGGRSYLIKEDDLIRFINGPLRKKSVAPKREAVQHKCLGEGMVTDYFARKEQSVASSAPNRKE